MNSLTSPVVAGAPSHDALSCDPPPPSEERHETRYYDSNTDFLSSRPPVLFAHPCLSFAFHRFLPQVVVSNLAHRRP